jgi:hypothetical protein
MTEEKKNEPGAPNKEELGAQKKEVDTSTPSTVVDEDKTLIESLQKDPTGIAKILQEKREANAEAKSYRLKLKEIEEAEAKKQEEALKEQNKWKELAEQREKQINDLKEHNRLSSIQTALEKEALKQGVIDTDVVGVVDVDQFVKYDDKTGKVEGVEEAIKDLKKKKPHFFKTPEKKEEPSKPKVDNSTPSLTTVKDSSKLTPRQKISQGLEEREAEGK